MTLELNPEHPVTQKTRDLWYKIAAILLHKHQLGKVEITTKDLAELSAAFAPSMPFIVVKEDGDTLSVWLAKEEEARDLAAKEEVIRGRRHTC